MSLCANSLEDYANQDCFENFAGGVRNLIIFQQDLPTNPSDASEIQALLDSGDAKLLTNLKVGMPEPSPITSPSMVSCSPEITINYDRTLSWIDANAVAGNFDFYNSLNNTTGFEAAGVLLHHCDVDRVQFITSPINFTGGFILPDDNTDQPQHWSFTAKFKAKGDPLVYETPAGIFD